MIAESIAVVIAAVLLAVRMMRQREFHVNRLWIQPAAVLVVLAFALYGSVVSTLFIGAVATGLVVGAGLGVLRARTSIDRVDLTTKSIMTKPNIWMAVLFAATFVLQMFVRHGPWSSFRDASDALICLTAASICAQRWQYYDAFRRASHAPA